MSYLWLSWRNEHDDKIVIMAVFTRLVAIKTLTL